MAGPVRTIESGVEGSVVAGVAVGSGGARGEVGARRCKTWRGAVVGRGIDVRGRRGVWGRVRGG